MSVSPLSRLIAAVVILSALLVTVPGVAAASANIVITDPATGLPTATAPFSPIPGKPETVNVQLTATSTTAGPPPSCTGEINGSRGSCSARDRTACSVPTTSS